MVFKVDTCRPSFDHALHQFECIEVAAKTSFRVGDEWSKPIHPVFSFRVVDLVGAHERLVDSSHEVGDAVSWIEALIGIHLSRIVGIGRDLPATDVDSLQTCLHLLYCLVTRHRAQSRDISFGMQQFPKALCA